MTKSIRDELDLPIAALLDTKGPESVPALKDEKKVTLKEGQTYTLTTREIVGDDQIGFINYNGLPADVEAGNTILIDDGLIELKVQEVVNGTDIICTVVNGGELGMRKGVNVPNVKIKLPALTEKDKADIRFGIEQN
ncbi:MAG: pyruvate kinase [Clostridia bacterium]